MRSNNIMRNYEKHNCKPFFDLYVILCTTDNKASLQLIYQYLTSQFNSLISGFINCLKPMWTKARFVCTSKESYVLSKERSIQHPKNRQQTLVLLRKAGDWIFLRCKWLLIWWAFQLDAESAAHHFSPQILARFPTPPIQFCIKSYRTSC